MPPALAQLHLLRPGWLLAGIPLAWLLWRCLRARDPAQRWQSLVDAALLPHVVIAGALTARRGVWLAALGAFLAILALAGPTWEEAPQPVYRDEAALVVLLDLSLSMATRDVTPSRLERARFRIRDLLAARRGGQTALVAFAAQPFTVTPLTDDVETIRAQLGVLEPGVMPQQGSAVAAAVQHGQALLKQAGFAQGDILLVTDGIAASDLRALPELLAGNGARLSVLGVGTDAGGPVPRTGGGFVTQEDGSLVVSRLDVDALTAAARAGSGRYQTASGQGAETEALAAFFAARLDGKAISETEQRARRWQDAGIWLLPPLLLVALLAFRRHAAWLVLFGLAALMGMPEARADWFRTPDQTAQQQFETGDYRGAMRGYVRPDWRAASAYRAGEFEAAAKALEGLADAPALYNRGNARARLGQYRQAAADYEAALGLQPDFPDARHNLALVREQMAEEAEKEKSAENEAEKEQSEQNQDSEGQQGQQGKDGQEGEAEDGQSEEGAKGEREKEDARKARENPERGNRQGSREDDAEGSADASAEDLGERAPPERATEAQAGEAGDAEQALATEQWLRQIPDDPGGLWRRKFLYQYRQRAAPETEPLEPW